MVGQRFKAAGLTSERFYLLFSTKNDFACMYRANMSTSSDSSESEHAWDSKKFAKSKPDRTNVSSKESSSSLEDDYSGEASGDIYENVYDGAADKSEESGDNDDANAAPEISEFDNDDYINVPKLIEQEVYIRAEDRRTSDIMSSAELSAVTVERIKQIESHNNPFCDGRYGSAKEMATAELRQRKCPLNLKRVIGTYRGVRHVEIWSPNEMVLPDQLSELI